MVLFYRELFEEKQILSLLKVNQGLSFNLEQYVLNVKYIVSIYSQTCIERSSLGRRERGLLGHVTS
jgi:hypothetical protein